MDASLGISIVDGADKTGISTASIASFDVGDTHTQNTHTHTHIHTHTQTDTDAKFRPEQISGPCSWTLGPDAVVMCHGTSSLNALPR